MQSTIGTHLIQSTSRLDVMHAVVTASVRDIMGLEQGLIYVIYGQWRCQRAVSHAEMLNMMRLLLQPLLALVFIL